MKSVSASSLRVLATGILGATLLAMYSADAAAANPDIIVTKFTDSLDGTCDADCSLREAVQRANNTPGASRIVLRAGTYRLTLAPELDEEGLIIDEDGNANGDLDIRGQLTLAGAGLDITNIDGRHIDRILEVFSGASVQVTNLTLRNGLQNERGGGMDIANGSTVLLRGVGVTNNVAGNKYEASGFAGGISNYGTLVIESSRVDGNRSSHGDGARSLSEGGGVYNKGTLTVRETRFIGNLASDRDEAGYGGAIYNAGHAEILRSSFDGNYVSIMGSGGSILNREGGTLRMENSTVANSGFEDSRPVGAVENGDSNESIRSTLRLINVTIAGNKSHGIVNYGRLDVTNSIVAGNRDSFLDHPPEWNCLNAGTNYVFSQKGLMLSTDTFTNCDPDFVVSNVDVFKTVLYPLALNNWVTPTFALKPRSPAVDVAIGGCPSTDQRRSSRPRDGDGDGVAKCDLGAYERPKP